MSLYASIKARLESIDGSIKKVETALSLTNAFNQSVQIDVAVFIAPLGEKPAPNSRITGPVTQEVTDTFGVLFSIRTANDKTGERSVEKLQGARKEVRNALLGWTPENATYHCEMAGSDLAKLEKGQVWWLDKYTTKHTETSVH